MSKKVLLFFLVVGALAALLAAGLPLRRSSAALNARAPDFRLAGLGGGLASLSDFSGQVVLLNFWATWCRDCRQEMPALETLYRRLKDRGFSVVAVSLDQDGRKSVAPFVSKLQLTYPVLLVDKKTPSAYGVYGLPTSYLIDPDGTIVRRYVGPVEPEALENDILDLLGKRRKT